MVVKATSAIVARRQARERLARERAEQAERNKSNEADLSDYLMLEQRIAAADSDRKAAIDAAHSRHQTVLAELNQRRAACLRRMSERGETPTAIADRTGLPVRDVKHLISSPTKRKSDKQAGPPPEKVRRSPGVGDAVTGEPKSGGLSHNDSGPCVPTTASATTNGM